MIDRADFSNVDYDEIFHIIGGRPAVGDEFLARDKSDILKCAHIVKVEKRGERDYSAYVKFLDKCVDVRIRFKKIPKTS